MVPSPINRYYGTFGNLVQALGTRFLRLVHDQLADVSQGRVVFVHGWESVTKPGQSLELLAVMGASYKRGESQTHGIDWNIRAFHAPHIGLVRGISSCRSADDPKPIDPVLTPSHAAEMIYRLFGGEIFRPNPNLCHKGLS
jgi:hypothetical protein